MRPRRAVHEDGDVKPVLRSQHRVLEIRPKRHFGTDETAGCDTRAIPARGENEARNDEKAAADAKEPRQRTDRKPFAGSAATTA